MDQKASVSLGIRPEQHILTGFIDSLATKNSLFLNSIFNQLFEFSSHKRSKWSDSWYFVLFLDKGDFVVLPTLYRISCFSFKHLKLGCLDEG